MPDSQADTLAIQDRFPVRVKALTADDIADLEAGRLTSRMAGRGGGRSDLQETVAGLMERYPEDQKPGGAIREALTLLDSKLDHLIHLAEEAREGRDESIPAPCRVTLGLDRIRVEDELPGMAEEGLQVGDLCWVACWLPGPSATFFEVVCVLNKTAAEGEAEFLFRNPLTKEEERIVAGHVFRKHRQDRRKGLG